MPAHCNIPDCPKRHYGRGYCQMHWARWRRTGSPYVARPHPTPPNKLLDFWQFVDFTETCWLWTGVRHTGGYGLFGGSAYAHRYAFEFCVEPIPAGLQIDHLCRVRACVNPDHLEAVTAFENWRRGEAASAILARQTHCKRGHEYTAANTYHRPDTPHKRMCRECQRVRGRVSAKLRYRKQRALLGRTVTPRG